MGANLYSTPQAGTAITTAGETPTLLVGPLSTLAVDIDVTTITGTGTPTITFFLERQGADGNWYPIWSPTAITTTGITSTSVGPGCATDAVVTENIRLRWTVSGTTPSFTTSISIIAR